jgi:hypothetical protein
MTPIPLGILALAGITGGGGAFDLLETTTLTSSASSVTFTGLGAYSDYKHLQIRMIARNGTSTSSPNITLNGDTGANYARHNIFGSGGSVTSTSATSSSNMDLVAFASNSNSGANEFGAGIIDILDFSSTAKNTTIRGLGGREQGDTSDFIALVSGAYFNTDAITSLSMNSPGTFTAGTRMSLYGVKGTS